MVKITSQATGAITHTHYNFGNGKQDTISSPSTTYPNSGNYKIFQQLTGPTGCITEDSANIRVRPVFSHGDSSNIGDVSVISPRYIYVQWATLPGVSVYDLYRYTDMDSNNKTLIAQTHYTILIDSNNLDPAAHVYTYSLLVEDSCGNVASSGRMGRNIRLSGALDPNLNPKLNWNPYKDWPEGVEGYVISRKRNPDSSFVYVGSTHDTTFTDLRFIQDPLYDECFNVVAYQNNNSAYSSTSNIFCFGNSPQIFVPNIFTPNGDTLNDLFVPVFSGIKSWSMTIINRWDEHIYSSSAPSLQVKSEGSGWDGNFKGQPVPQGVYIYDIKSLDYNGNFVSKQGTVTLQR